MRHVMPFLAISVLFVFFVVRTLFLLLLYILHLSHKSGALCLYEPLPVSDALGDDFFETFHVFLVDFFFSKLITLHGPTAAKKTVAPKKTIFCSLSRENNSTKK